MTPLAALWVWRYHDVDVDIYPSFDEAVGMWWGVLDSGTGSPDSIECDGVRYTRDHPRVAAVLDKIEADVDAQAAERERTAPKLTYRVEIQHPTAGWFRHTLHVDDHSAYVEGERIVAVLGPDRVRVLPI